jgi:hypothetical protein
VNLGWSEEMADALIADAQTFGINVKEGLEKINVEQAFIDWLTTSVKNIGGQQVIDEGQFKAFMEASGLDPEVVEKALNEQGIEVKSALKEGEGLADWVKESIMQQFDAENPMDLQSTYELLLELGLDDEAAKEQLKELVKEMDGVEFTLDGQSVAEAGGIIGEGVYAGTSYSSIEGLIDGVTDKRVKLNQEKSALEQA